MNRIYIRDLHLRCIIGVFPHERKDRQDVIVNIVMECDFGAAAASDELKDTVDYKAITKKIIRMIENSEFQLIESLAQQTAQICMENQKVSQVSVTVDKPGALRFCRSVAVETILKR